MNLSNKFSLIPEIGLGLMSYNGHPENTEIFTVRKTIENQFLEFNGNLITSSVTYFNKDSISLLSSILKF